MCGCAWEGVRGPAGGCSDGGGRYGTAGGGLGLGLARRSGGRGPCGCLLTTYEDGAVDAADGAANDLGADRPVQLAGRVGGNVVHGVDPALERLARGVELGDGVVLRQWAPHRLVVRSNLALGSVLVGTGGGVWWEGGGVEGRGRTKSVPPSTPPDSSAPPYSPG